MQELKGRLDFLQFKMQAMEEAIAKTATTPLVWVRRPKVQKAEQKKQAEEIKNLSEKSALSQEEMDKLRQSIALEIGDQIALDVEQRLRIEFQFFAEEHKRKIKSGGDLGSMIKAFFADQERDLEALQKTIYNLKRKRPGYGAAQKKKNKITEEDEDDDEDEESDESEYDSETQGEQLETPAKKKKSPKKGKKQQKKRARKDQASEDGVD